MSDQRQRALLPDSVPLPLAPRRRLPVFGLDWPRLTTSAEILCAGLAGLIAAYVVWSMVRLVVASALPVPFWDQWKELIFSGRRTLSSWLFSQHNEHRLVFPRLIFFVDYWLFDEDNRFDFICNLTLPCLICAGVLVILWQALTNWRERVWVAGAVAALLFSAMQWENFAWGFQVGWFLVELGAVGAFAALGLRRTAWSNVSIAIFAETVSMYSLASGASVPIIAILLATWRRYSVRQIGVLVVAAIALLGFYLHGYQTPSDHSNPFALLGEFRPVAEYIAVDLGNPLAQLAVAFGVAHPTRIAGIAGAVGALAFGYAAIVLTRSPREPSGSTVVLLTTATYGLSTAVLTALGRVRFGLPQAESSRYSTPMLLFWLALALIGFTDVVRHRPRLRLPAMLVGLCCLVPIAAAQAFFVKEAVSQILLRKEAEAALLAGISNNDALAKVFAAEQIPLVLRQTNRLRRRHLALFADPWSEWRGAPLREHVRILDGPGRCRGGIGEIRRVPTRDGRPGWTASGWAWDQTDNVPLQRIVLTDEQGRVIGYGLGGFSPPRASEEAASGWRGYFAISAAAPVSAYALLNGGAVACRVGTDIAETSKPPKFVSESKVDRVEDCSLDTIDGRLFSSLKEPIVVSDDQLDVAGWTAPAARRGIGPEATWISLTAADGKRRFYPADTVGRPDVLAYFRQPRMKRPGFTAALDLSGLTGTQKMAIYSTHDNNAYRCPQQAVLQLGRKSAAVTKNAK